MQDVSALEVHLGRLHHNLATLQSLVGSACRLCPIIKSDAYGLGAVPIARAMRAFGIRMVAVYSPAEALQLALADIPLAKLVLMPVRDADLPAPLLADLRSGHLHFTVHDLQHVQQLALLAESAGRCPPIPVHLEIDTGLSRGGTLACHASAILHRLAHTPSLCLAGIFTHFARAESDADFTASQAAAFDAFLADHRALIPADCCIHLSSTYSALATAVYHRSMVRIGLAWVGCGRECLTSSSHLPLAEKLQPILAWRSSIIHIKSVPAGTPVGYGSRWVAQRPSTIGLVPVGYADGYPTTLSNTACRTVPALVGVQLQTPTGPVMRYVPVIGSVNMDQITIDLTDVCPPQIRAAGDIAESIASPAHCGPQQARDAQCSPAVPVSVSYFCRAHVGARVELISADPAGPNHLTTFARHAGVGGVPHVILCALNPRIPRRYVNSSSVIVEVPPIANVAGVADEVAHMNA